MPIRRLLFDKLKTRVARAPGRWVRYINLLGICISMGGEIARENTVGPRSPANQAPYKDEHPWLTLVRGQRIGDFKG